MVGSFVGGEVMGDMVGGSSLPAETVGVIEVGRRDGIGVGRRDGIGVGRRDGIGVGRRDGIGVGRRVGLPVGSLVFLAAPKSRLSPFLAWIPVERHAALMIAKTVKTVLMKAIMVRRWMNRCAMAGNRAQYDARDRK